MRSLICLSVLVDIVPLRVKIGAPDDVEKSVLSAIPGVRLHHAPQVPAAAPVRPNTYYFSLESKGQMYERMLQAKSTSIYVPSGIRELRLELMNGSGPQDRNVLLERMVTFLDDFGRNAKRRDASADDVDAAKYAFCAAVDEIILRSPYGIREAWERRPLQLVVFGDQLAGENFFVRLENLRARGSVHVQALEVFHMCLLLGFQGRYILEGSEKLNYLTARLGDEIANMKGKAAPFAPHAQRPDQIVNKLRNDVPLWVVCSVFALICALGYIGLRTSLNSNTANKMNAYNDIVKLAPRAANLTITLP